jgi:hypothetical protein
LPPNVRVLCSCLSLPATASRLLSAFAERGHVAVALRPLSDRERQDIVRAVPKLVAKTLDDRQMGALMANPATRNPLFLMVALEELRGFGSFERLNEMIRGLPSGPEAVTDVFDQIVEALSRRIDDPVGLATSLGNQAMIRKATGDLDGALRLHREEEAICRRLNDPAGLQRSLGDQAMVRKMVGDLDEALRLHREEEAICRRTGDPAGLGPAWAIRG